MSRLSLDALAALLLLVAALVVIDLWRGGQRWLAAVLSAAAWTILVIVVALGIAP